MLLGPAGRRGNGAVGRWKMRRGGEGGGARRWEKVGAPREGSAADLREPRGKSEREGRVGALGGHMQMQLQLMQLMQLMQMMQMMQMQMRPPFPLLSSLLTCFASWGSPPWRCGVPLSRVGGGLRGTCQRGKAK